jgi:hypothetical protein
MGWQIATTETEDEREELSRASISLVKLAAKAAENMSPRSEGKSP